MSTADMARSPEQVIRERALNKVFDSIEEIEIVTGRLRRYGAEVAKMPDCDHLAKCIVRAADQLEAARKELQQGGYFGTGQGKLF
jgi:hypothetical protein